MKNNNFKNYWQGYRDARDIINNNGYGYALDIYDGLAYENASSKGYKRYLNDYRKKHTETCQEIENER